MNCKSGYILLFLFLIIRMTGISQVDSDDSLSVKSMGETLNYDTNYIASYTEVFTPRLIISNKKNIFTISEKESGKSIEYQPNSPLNLGFGLTYKWFSFNVAFNFPFINKDDDIFGKTRRLDIQTNIFGRSYVIDIFLQYYRGFYIANPNIIDPDWMPGNPYPLRGDVVSLAFGVSGFYVFNHKKFSYRAAFNFNERQKKSKGSFTVGGGVINYRISSDSGLVPTEIFPDSVVAINFDLVKIGSTFAIGGYTYTFIIRNWYFNLGLGLGLGLSTTKTTLTTNVELENKSRISVVTDFRGSVGYNSDRYYVGLSWATGAFAISSSKDILVTYGLSKINFYVGYRFYQLFD